jgi:hypothetical protein
MCFHLDSNGRFVSRLQVDDALGMLDRGNVVVAPRSLFCQPHEGPVRLGSEFRSLVQDPVVIASWKEIARIEARGELEITDRYGFAEPQHVDLARPGRNPPDNLVVDLDELTDIGKGMPEVVEQLSEVGASLTFVGVGPELERESRAVLQISPQRDQRQEPLQAKIVESAETAAVQDDFDCTEQSDLEPRRRFATDPAPVTRHTAPLVVCQPG